MKKIALLILCMCSMLGQAQLKDYMFTKTVGTYSEISGGTVLGSATTTDQYFVDPNVPAGILASQNGVKGPGLPIPFNFTFNGKVYDMFGVSTEGWISLGSSTASPDHINMTVGVKDQPISSGSVGGNTPPDDLRAAIAALAVDLSAQADSSLRFQTIGTGTNRILVVQWKNYKRASGTGDSYSFQIRLHETTNVVEFAYGGFTVASGAPLNCQVGLRGAPAATATNYANLKSFSGWDNPTSTGNTASDTMSLTSQSFPSNGLTYTWSPPVCGLVNTLAVSNITDNSAVLNWTAGAPTPASYEYVVKTSTDLPTGSGTPTTATTVNVGSLSVNTVYNVFIRSMCTAGNSEWKLVGNFRTQCLGVTVLFEDFDSFSVNTMPDCWSNAGTTTGCTSTIRSGLTAPSSPPNGLNLAADGVGAAYAILPAMSNLSAGTNRLRFKGYTTLGYADFDLGYFVTSGNVTSFHTIVSKQLPVQLPGTINTTEFIFTPTDLAGIPSEVKNLVLRNDGPGNAFFNIDDVVWEPNPTCPDVSALVAKNIIHNSATISWTAGSTTAWQYAYALSTVKEPFGLTGVPVTGANPTVQIPGLSPSTSYKVWIRSDCHDSVGAWIGPVIFETTCTPISEIYESFDAGTGLPVCWRKVGATGSANTSTSLSPPTAPNSLALGGNSSSQFTVVALPPLSNSGAANHQLKLKFRGSAAGIILQIGYLDDLADASTFHILQEVVTGTSFVSQTYTLGSGPKSPYLAFRNPGSPAGTVYIDDVVWEPIPTCAEVSNISAIVNSNSATMRWSANGSDQWQYVLGSSSDMNPFLLTAKDMPNPVVGFSGITSVITGLTPNTANKIWIRSNCGGSSFGSWVGPVNIVTSCAPGTAFAENFDASTNIPSCWTRSGTTGTGVVVGSPSSGTPSNVPSSSPNVLTLKTSTTSGPAVVAMPAMSNTAAGTHRLKFKFRSGNGQGDLEVGYLLSIADPSTFVPLGQAFKCTTNFQSAKVELGTEPASQILAFRNTGTAFTFMDVDDVVWEPIPPCEDIAGLAVSSVTDTTISFKWTKGSTDSAWQYAVGPATLTNPDQLTFHDVTGATPEATASPLSPNTLYKVWVRAKCNVSEFGQWSEAVTAKTTCEPVSDFTENFNGSDSIPGCWTVLTTSTSTSLRVVAADTSEPNDGNKLFIHSGSPSATSMIALPPLSNASAGDHILRFKMKGSQVGAQIEVGFIDNILDPTTFTPILTFSATSKTVSDVFTWDLGASPTSNIIAFRNPGQVNAGVSIDDVSWGLDPTLPPACVVSPTATPNANCGNFATVITWNAVSGADGYRIEVIRSSDGSVLVTDELGSKLTYSFIGAPGTAYKYLVKPYNSIGEAHDCVQSTFSTNANSCYCVSAPAANNGLGITKVQVAATEFVPTDLTYIDFGDKPVDAGKGINTALKLTFDTNLQFNAKVWIDLNNDYVFDAAENVFTGVSAIKSSLNIVDSSFLIAADAALGMHKMRIVTWSGSASAGNACYNGSEGVTLDFMVNVVDPFANDNPINAVALVVGSDFAANAITGSNVNATPSTPVPAPGCGNYNGGDVWYKAVVPSSGSLTFEVNTVSGGLVNTDAAVYSGAIGSFVLVLCDDSSSTAGNNNPKISVTGRTPGEVLYLRVWENGNDTFGQFKVSAYDATLGLDVFDSNNFSFYPNPVNDILNLSFNQEMDSVSVMNLLGQQVISKTLNSNQGMIDMSGMSRGVYLVKVTVGNQSKTIKVVKE